MEPYQTEFCIQGRESDSTDAYYTAQAGGEEDDTRAGAAAPSCATDHNPSNPAALRILKTD
jgi:hypothetical protein